MPTPTKKNPVARAVRAKKPSVVPNKKKPPPEYDDYDIGFSDGYDAALLDEYRREVDATN